MQFWQRAIKVTIGQAGSGGISFANYDSKGTTIEIDVIKDSTKKTNKAVIKLYNLNNKASNYIAMPESVIEVYAGWNGKVSRIFLGTTLSCDDTYSGTDKITTIIATDGGKELNSSVVSIAYSEGKTTTALLKKVCDQLGLSLQMGNGVGEITYTNGWSFVGKGQDALDEICDSISAMWFIDNGVLQVVNYDGYGKNTSYEINAGSGLIGTPSHIVIDNYFQEKKKSNNKGGRSSKNGYGYNITCLLNPYINVKDLVHITSKTITDYMYVESIRYRGATNKGTFVCEIVGIKTGGA